MAHVRFPPSTIDPRQAVAPPPSLRPQRAGQAAFDAFLTAAKEAALPAGGAPPSKAELLALIGEIRARMNSRWLDALAGEGRGDAPFPLAGFTPPVPVRGSESSNKYHPNQNNDVSPLPGQLAETIAAAAGAHGVDPALVRSVIKAESGFKADSTSPRGAMGLMQLMPATARELGVHNAYDPVENVWAGTRYLKGLLDRYDGQVELALAAYNWGMGNLERRPGEMPAETLRYVRKVTADYERGRA